MERVIIGMVEEVPPGVRRRGIVQVQGSLGDTCSPAVSDVAVTYGQRNAAIERNMYLARVRNSYPHLGGMAKRRAQDDSVSEVARLLRL